MGAIIKRELKSNIKSVIIWTISLVAISLMMTITFKSMEGSLHEMNEMIKSMPKALLSAVGMDGVDMTTMEGFYSEGYTIILLVGSIFASYLAASILVKEQDDKTCEYLLTKPISRATIYLSKYIVVLVAIIILSIITGITTYTGIAVFSSGEYVKESTLLLSFAPTLVYIAFASISFGISTLINKTKTAMGISIGIVFAMYFMTILAGISDKLEWLSEINFFSYVSSGKLISEKIIETEYIVVMIVVSIISILAGNIIYKKKDL